MNPIENIEEEINRLQNELQDPNLSELRKYYLSQKLQTLEEFVQGTKVAF
ncbi:MAG: hypothetical protein H0W73_11405 [Bacteroidetes bacterium]|nr:hypothetical protein [Bacteroidota bacterium]